ncbi:putative toxin-antitoxin system toxin component, PIN family [Spirosoma sp. HMF4905]|uniref:Putative toxin-antitoxin system toxin component, PIN family n=1 Tax=Spirosoma arboris TaxID=2682092 RepID=A0A7K1SBU2_9BACT|nr:putative toxin-antitoxin system toxin component, PIN family [Spirosoma arboris]MVM31036.1 putative toxin-antitoxin system toxin component, PIN family [Spirosoma arboris]
MKAVIDTNGLLNAISKRGSKKWLYNAFIAESFIWVFSNEILTEYDEVIGRKFSQDVANYVISSLLVSANHERFEPSYKYQLVTKDPDDNKFVDCAIGANVDYLVTDDRHILSLLTIPDLFPPVPIVTFTQFRNILKD